MTRAPRRPGERLLDRATAVRVLVTGVVVATTSLTSAATVDALGGPWQPTLFVTLGLSQLAVALGLRPWRTSWRQNLLLPASVALDVGLLVAALYWSPLQHLLRTATLPPVYLIVCTALALVAGAIGSVVANVDIPTSEKPRKSSESVKSARADSDSQVR